MIDWDAVAGVPSVTGIKEPDTREEAVAVNADVQRDSQTMEHIGLHYLVDLLQTSSPVIATEMEECETPGMLRMARTIRA